MIDQAIGILGSRTGESAEEAFHRLRQISQSENVKLAVITQDSGGGGPARRRQPQRYVTAWSGWAGRNLRDRREELRTCLGLGDEATGHVGQVVVMGAGVAA